MITLSTSPAVVLALWPCLLLLLFLASALPPAAAADTFVWSEWLPATCGQFALHAASVSFASSAPTPSVVDINEGDVWLASPVNTTFGRLEWVDRTMTATNNTCKVQLDELLLVAHPCDHYARVDTTFVFADGSRGDGIGYWSHLDGNTSRPMQMRLTPGVYCAAAAAPGASQLVIRDPSGRAGALLLDSQGVDYARFMFLADTIVHGAGTDVALLNRSSPGDILWHANHALTIGAGSSSTQTRTMGVYATRPGGITRIRNTKLSGLVASSGAHVEFEGYCDLLATNLALPGIVRPAVDPPLSPSSNSTASTESKSNSSDNPTVVLVSVLGGVSLFAAVIWYASYTVTNRAEAKAKAKAAAAAAKVPGGADSLRLAHAVENAYVVQREARRLLDRAVPSNYATSNAVSGAMMHMPLRPLLLPPPPRHANVAYTPLS